MLRMMFINYFFMRLFCWPGWERPTRLTRAGRWPRTNWTPRTISESNISQFTPLEYFYFLHFDINFCRNYRYSWQWSYADRWKCLSNQNSIHGVPKVKVFKCASYPVFVFSVFLRFLMILTSIWLTRKVLDTS